MIKFGIESEKVCNSRDIKGECYLCDTKITLRTFLNINNVGMWGNVVLCQVPALPLSLFFPCD